MVARFGVFKEWNSLIQVRYHPQASIRLQIDDTMRPGCRVC